MTAFGLIWLYLIFFCYTRKNIKYMVYLTLYSMVIQSSNVISIGNLSVGPQIITNIAFIFLYFINNCSMKIKKNTMYSNILILMFGCVIISSILNNSLIINLLKIMQLLTYMISFSIMVKLYNKIDKEDIHNCFRNITIFVLVMGIIQFITTSGILPRIPVISYLFYNEHTENVYYWHQNYNRLCSTFMEASYCGSFLVGAFYYFISIWKNNNKYPIIIVLLIIEIILTKSSSTYLSMIICGFALSIVSRNKKSKRFFISVSLISIIVLFVFYYDILNAVIFSKASSGSAITRNYWNMNALKGFKQSKLIGVGYKNLRASSIIYSLLGELGILGIFLYIIFNLLICLPLLKKNIYKESYKSGIRFAVLGVIITQIVACPDLDFCVYWMFIYFVGLYGVKIYNNKSDYI